MDERNVAPMDFFHKKNAITKVSLQAKIYIACIKGFFGIFMLVCLLILCWVRDNMIF
jgi:hypothetical protein